MKATEEKPRKTEDEENFEDDIYLVELHKRLAAMKNERKKAEQDAKVLENRLKLLHGEETKTVKKIEVTKKKTQEKMTQLRQAEDNLKFKLALKEEREKELEDRKANNSKLKSELELSLELKRELKMKQISEESRLLKEQKKLNEEMLNYIKNEEMVNNKSKAEYVKNQHIQLEEKKRAIELERKQKIRADLEKKLYEEMLLKEQAEGKITNLEQEEIDIMRKIRTTTQVHRALVEDFERINVDGIKAINTQSEVKKPATAQPIVIQGNPNQKSGFGGFGGSSSSFRK